MPKQTKSILSFCLFIIVFLILGGLSIEQVKIFLRDFFLDNWLYFVSFIVIMIGIAYVLLKVEERRGRQY